MPKAVPKVRAAKAVPKAAKAANAAKILSDPGLPRLRLQLQHLVAEVPGDAMSRAASIAGALAAVAKMGALDAVALRCQAC